jgi:3-hydroxymyristoyl/3-hydroxydecanoyl-(acyl carrier protein) dehydratase
VGTQVEALYNLADEPEKRAWLLAQAGGLKPVLPYAAINEMALQSCGFLAAFMGSALPFPGPMHFRNLGGEATLIRPLDQLSGQVLTRATLTKSSVLGTMTIQHYQFSLSWEGQTVYEGQTHFGFHSPESLAKPLGLKANPGLLKALVSPAAQGLAKPYPQGPAWPQGPWRMVESLVSDIKGDGRVWGRTSVDPKAWFFTAHFPQDPVWPGSLGLEGFFQTAKSLWAALFKPQIPADDLSISWQAPVYGQPHRWLYRGQIIPTNREVTFGLKVIARKNDLLTLKGLLWVDGQVVYQVDDLTVTGES